jgi:adenosine kinase
MVDLRRSSMSAETAALDSISRASRRFIDALVRRRKELGFSQTEVAANMGTSQSTVAKIEAYSHDPRLTTIQRYARAVRARIDLVARSHFPGGVPEPQFDFVDVQTRKPRPIPKGRAPEIQLAVFGCIAFDIFLSFPGEFGYDLPLEALSAPVFEGESDHVLSLVRDEEPMIVRYGGIASNICYLMGRLGLKPLLVGSVGRDFERGYGNWLERNAVDISFVHVSDDATSRFVSVRDDNFNQLTTFYPLGMREIGAVDYDTLIEQLGQNALAIITPSYPEAVLEMADKCREAGVPFVADPSQRMSWFADSELRHFVNGAEYLIGNRHEMVQLQARTGWSEESLLDRVGLRITTLGSEGVYIDSRDGAAIRVKAAFPTLLSDPFGVGEAFRAGFFVGRSFEMSLERSAQLGCTVSSLLLESPGTQAHDLERGKLLDRLAGTYGVEASEDIERALFG